MEEQMVGCIAECEADTVAGDDATASELCGVARD
jgi:hypothetical protein